VLAIVFALAAALGYGGSDFAAGLASREASVIRVTFVAEAASVVLMLLVVPWVSTGAPSSASVGWAVAAGVGGMGGAMALYLGFRHAAFSVAAPLSAVATAAFSVLAGLLFGEHPGGLALAGIALALPAIVAVSASSPSSDTAEAPASPEGSARSDTPAASALSVSPAKLHNPASSTGTPSPANPASPANTASPINPTSRIKPVSASDLAADGDGDGNGNGGGEGGSGRHLAGVLYGLAAGAGFGVLFIGLNRAGSGSDLWPAVIAQLAGLAFVSVLGVARGQLRLPHWRAGWLAVLTGVTGAGGTLCYFVATHAGLLAVTAVITSLYPASTILLARLLVGERITKIRVAGLGLAAASVALIAIAGTG
jgi:drug/metabolite transporter (DMT)-like permease